LSLMVRAIMVFLPPPRASFAMATYLNMMSKIMHYGFLIFKPRMITTVHHNEIMARHKLTNFDKHPFQQHLSIWIGSSIKLAPGLADVIQ
jgi:hypothetical protein